jgi:hypothetical protein
MEFPGPPLPERTPLGWALKAEIPMQLEPEMLPTVNPPGWEKEARPIQRMQARREVFVLFR